MAWLLWELARGGTPWTPAFCVAFLSLLAQPTFFWGSLAAYLSTFRWHGGDDIDVSLIPIALLRYGTLALDRVIDPFLTGKTNDFTIPAGGHLLSFHPVAPGILALPVYLLPMAAGAPVSELFLHHLSKISGACLTALSVPVFHYAIKDRCSRDWARVLTSVYAFGSFAFSISSQALWQHGPSQLAVGLALLSLARQGLGWDALGGFGLGLGLAVRSDNVWWALAAGCYLLFHERRRIPGFALGAAVPLILLGLYHWHYTGGLAPPQSAVLGRFFVPFMPDAFLALALSPTRGLLFFCPAAIFGLWAARGLRKDPLAPWLLVGCLATWLFFSCFSLWVGGMTFGPRYFAVVAMVLLYLCAGLEERIRSSPAALASWSAACAASIGVHALGAYLTWPGDYGVWSARERAWQWSLHPALNLLRPDGPLGRWPVSGRAAALLLWVFLCAWGAVYLRRSLSQSAKR